MAQWNETLEPYVKVYEKVKTAALNPTVGDSLIIGCPLISDAGPSTPTLIRGQKEFLETFASRDLTKDYISTLNDLYKGDVSDMAETMWLNAYRLAGSNTLLVVRASKADDIFFAKSLEKDDKNTYLVRDGQLLKLCPSFKIVIDSSLDSANQSSDGWSMALNGVGVIGNRNSDNGAEYDYFVKDLRELVDYLNETPLFFSPNYKFCSDDKGEIECSEFEEPVSVVFNEVYLGPQVLDKTDTRCPEGLSYLITCEPDWTSDNPAQKTIDLNSTAYSDFVSSPWYATNVYNSSTDLKVRIRRFNHDAVVSNENTPDAYAGGVSSYTVLTSVLDTFCHDKNGNYREPNADVLYRDFYEIAVLDPSISSEPICFNVGNILGRGDMSVSDVNDSLKMIQLQLPDDLHELGLGYYGYLPKSKKEGWAIYDSEEGLTGLKGYFSTKSEAEEALSPVAVGDVVGIGHKDPVYYVFKNNSWEVAEGVDTSKIEISYKESSLGSLESHIVKPKDGEYAQVGDTVKGTYYIWKSGLALKDLDPEEIYVDLSIDPTKYDILDVSDSDILKALDKISLDEVYVTEGLSDLGCTSPMVQSYMANMAINDNYFYPFSTVKSTNYLSIANGVSRMSQDSYKLYTSAPWDVDTGTVGWKYYVSPSTLYWESVGRNKTLGREFAPLLGQTNGVAQYQKPMTEFNKKTRQLLLSRKINTVMWNNSTSAFQWNDDVTFETEDNILKDDANSRLFIRINKSMPVLLRQFIGRRIGEILYKDMENTIDYWFTQTILPLEYGVDGYRVTISGIQSDELARQNKVKVLIQVRFARSLKYIDVYSEAYDVGMSYES